jgi:hypothetical protein
MTKKWQFCGLKVLTQQILANSGMNFTNASQKNLTISPLQFSI